MGGTMILFIWSIATGVAIDIAIIYTRSYRTKKKLNLLFDKASELSHRINNLLLKESKLDTNSLKLLSNDCYLYNDKIIPSPLMCDPFLYNMDEYIDLINAIRKEDLNNHYVGLEYECAFIKSVYNTLKEEVYKID